MQYAISSGIGITISKGFQSNTRFSNCRDFAFTIPDLIYWIESGPLESRGSFFRYSQLSFVDAGSNPYKLKFLDFLICCRGIFSDILVSSTTDTNWTKDPGAPRRCNGIS